MILYLLAGKNGHISDEEKRGPEIHLRSQAIYPLQCLCATLQHYDVIFHLLDLCIKFL